MLVLSTIGRILFVNIKEHDFSDFSRHLYKNFDKLVNDSPMSLEIPKNKTVKSCPEGKILNEKTGRCIKDKTAKKKLVKEILKIESPKIPTPPLPPKIESPEIPPPPPKIESPKMPPPPPPEIPKIDYPKMQSPQKISNPKKIKVCPEGKILNEKTGRCIKQKTPKIKIPKIPKNKTVKI